MELKNHTIGTDLSLKNGMVNCNGGPLAKGSFEYLLKLQGKYAEYDKYGNVTVKNVQIEAQPEAAAA